MEKSPSASASPPAPLLIFAKTLLRQQEISPKKRFFAIGLQKNKAMTTLTLQFDNPSIIHAIDVPNELTMAAMKEAESGNDAGTVKIDSLENFISSLQ